MPQHGEHVHALLIRWAEHLDDLAFRRCLLGFPMGDFHDHFVANVRLAADITRFRNINGPRQTRIIRCHMQELLRTLQGAHKLRALAFQNFDHAAAPVLLPRLYVEAHQNTVAMHRRARVVVRDADFGHARFIRLHKAAAAPRDLNHSGHQVGFLRHDVAIAFCTNDFSLFLQAFEQALQHLLLIGLHAKLGEQLWHIGG